MILKVMKLTWSGRSLIPADGRDEEILRPSGTLSYHLVLSLLSLSAVPVNQKQF